jgi:hypothetical protein
MQLPLSLFYRDMFPCKEEGGVNSLQHRIATARDNVISVFSDGTSWSSGQSPASYSEGPGIYSRLGDRLL